MSKVIFEGIFHTIKHRNIRKKQVPPILMVYSGFTVQPVSQTQWNTVVDLTQKITF